MSPPSFTSRVTAHSLTGASCVLILLYAGRAVLAPLALAAILSLVAAPLVRFLRRAGLPHWPATLATLLFAAGCVAGATGVLASQLVKVGAELPRYRAAIDQKTLQLRALAGHPFRLLDGGWNAPGPLLLHLDAATAEQPTSAAALPGGDALAQLVQQIWEPLGKVGIVLVLLLFILLEHESLQDRLIRLGRQSEISRTVRALADAAQGVSRFFLSQCLVNAGVGVAVGTGLWALAVPHPLLWGICSAIARFIPYLGALVAGAAIGCFAAAIAPGWQLALSVVVLFGALELVVSNFVEPKVYGHSTGLSPLAVILSALFWSALWGPVGLLISTPLTVCFVVAGRYVDALEFISTLLGEAPDVSAAQRFFQRALAGDTLAILDDARSVLRRDGFARYCDHTLLPGLALAAAELRLGVIDTQQLQQLRHTVAQIAEALAPPQQRTNGRRRVPLLYTNIGAHLRQVREARLGLWQGPLDVPLRSVVLCAGLPAERDELVAELLALALRAGGADARSVTLPVPLDPHDADKAELVSTVFIPCPLADTADAWHEAVQTLRTLVPHALLVALRLPGDETPPGYQAIEASADMVLRSFGECLAFVNANHSAPRMATRT